MGEGPLVYELIHVTMGYFYRANEQTKKSVLENNSQWIHRKLNKLITRSPLSQEITVQGGIMLFIKGYITKVDY